MLKTDLLSNELQYSEMQVTERYCNNRHFNCSHARSEFGERQIIDNQEEPNCLFVTVTTAYVFEFWLSAARMNYSAKLI